MQARNNTSIECKYSSIPEVFIILQFNECVKFIPTQIKINKITNFEKKTLRNKTPVNT